METATEHARPIVADPDVNFLQKIFYECRQARFSPVVVNCPDKLKSVVRQPNTAFSGIFLNPRLIRAGGSSVLLHLRESLPNTPIFFLLDETTVPAPEPGELRKLTVADCLKKPFSHFDLQRALSRSPSAADFQIAVEMAEDNLDPVDTELDLADEDFSPIRARNFVAGRETYFDLYVRINPRRYVKILKAGDLFSAKRINEYLRLEFFYIRRKVQERYLQYCDRFVEALLANNKVPLEVKTSHTMNLGEETSQFLRLNGVQESTVNYAVQFAKKSLDVSMQIAGKKDQHIRQHLEQGLHFDHSVSVTMVASLLATHLNFEQDRATRIVGLAAMLHDVGMSHITKELHDVDPEDLTSEELAIYEAHPLIGQEILRKIPSVEPIVIQAVGQHHERRNGRGFPNRLKSGSINIVAEIIGISEEFIELLKKANVDPSIEVMREMERKLNGFSSSTAASFRFFFGRGVGK